MRRKTLCVMVAAMMSISLPATVMAMPSDIREGEAYEEELAEELQEEADAGMADGGDLIDDSDLLQPVGENYVAVGPANVRSYPNGTIIDNLVTGKSYYVSDRRVDCNWYKISGYATNAYVYGDYLIPREEYLGNRAGGVSDESDSVPAEKLEALDIMMKATTTVNMRKSPNGEIIGQLKEGKDIHVIGHAGSDINWYKCKYKKKEVYIYDDYLIPDFPQTMKATHNLNVRSGPSTDYAIIGSLAIGEKVKVSSEENGWLKFTDPETGEIGYSHGDYMAAAAK